MTPKTPLSHDYAKVAVNLPLFGAFTFRVPPQLRSSVAAGVRALVPFGNRVITALVVEHPSAPLEGRPVKEIIKLLDPEPILTPDLLRLTEWISRYYFAPLGEAINAAMPKGIDLKSAETASITEKGKRAVPYIGDTSGKLLLMELVSGKPVKVSTLKRRFKGESFAALLKRYSREGLLSVEMVMEEPRVREQAETFYSLTADWEELPSARKRLSGKMKDIIRFLSGGERSMAEIRDSFKNPAPTLKRLKERGVVIQVKKTRYRSPLEDGHIFQRETERPKTLTPDQRAAFDKISGYIAREVFRPVLLHGVTGSGKTEVYLHSIAETIKRGRQAILLVPEISLTPQMISRFKARFGNRVALLHSGLSSGERYDEWRRIRKGETDVAVGARSAVFAPFARLGLIVVDEEHEPSFKQEESPRYHARDVALMRAKECGAVAILGSATPSLESVENARTGKFDLMTLADRISPYPMPPMTMVDMRTVGLNSRGAIMSEPLRSAIGETLERGEQLFLFLNRRGTSRFVQCRECGVSITCESCSVTMTYHGKVREIRCHYCNSYLPAPDKCPSCGGEKIFFMGYGTQKLEDEVKDFFPAARVARMDRDAVRTKGSFFKIFNMLNKNEIDILIGTQMIAKGHDFPNVTLVGILNADASINIPDFRSAERSFQLVFQVAGRAGRADKPGRVIVQSYNPDHYVYAYLSGYDFDGFAQRETNSRRVLSYPPFSRLAAITVEGGTEKETEGAARELTDFLKSGIGPLDEMELLGPSAAMVLKVRERYRWRLLLKGRDLKRFRRFLSERLPLVFQKKWDRGGVRVMVDIDPVSIV